MSLCVDVSFQAPDEDESQTAKLWPTQENWQRHAEIAIAAALAESAYGPYPVDLPVLVEVFFTNDAAMARLNGEHRGMFKPTNVLSFQASDPASLKNPVGALLLGSIVLAHGICAEEAKAQKKSFAAHITHLIVHGTLHLLGYDHENDDDAVIMETLERRAMAALNLPDPYVADHGHS